MRRWLLIAIAAGAAAVAACGDDGGRHTPDAQPDSAVGSGARTSEFEASPRDGKLELGVLVLSVVVIAGPASLRQRREI
jgi:hypothetical protein